MPIANRLILNNPPISLVPELPKSVIAQPGHPSPSVVKLTQMWDVEHIGLSNFLVAKIPNRVYTRPR